MGVNRTVVKYEIRGECKSTNIVRLWLIVVTQQNEARGFIENFAKLSNMRNAIQGTYFPSFLDSYFPR